ncbi:hypothetical protein VTJ04DRAFT_6810 [Mycothermus thermophilus]|uniref:uncharacterized protein n=1 Tax=Humicola insolens TaxID=85995 RepID=UPI0037432D4B
MEYFAAQITPVTNQERESPVVYEVPDHLIDPMLLNDNNNNNNNDQEQPSPVAYEIPDHGQNLVKPVLLINNNTGLVPRDDALEWKNRYKEEHEKLREARRENRRKDGIIREMREEIQRLRDRTGRVGRFHERTWPDELRDYLRNYHEDPAMYEKIYKLSCKEENMSTVVRKVHPSIELAKPVETPRPHPDWVGFTRGHANAGPPAREPAAPADGVCHFDRLPHKPLVNILKHLLYKPEELIHCLSRLDKFQQPDSFPSAEELGDNCSGLPKRFFWGRRNCNITQDGVDPQRLLAVLGVNRQLLFLGVHIFYGLNTFAFSSLGEMGRFFKGIGKARLSRIQHFELLWVGNQYLTFAPENGKTPASKRTYALSWLLELPRLRTLVVHVDETSKQHIRRKNESREVKNLLHNKTADQPNKRMTRSLWNLQGLDYLRQKRGLDAVRFYDFNRAHRAHEDVRKRVKDWSFAKDIERIAHRKKKRTWWEHDALEAVDERLPVIRLDEQRWGPGQEDWTAVKEIYTDNGSTSYDELLRKRRQRERELAEYFGFNDSREGAPQGSDAGSDNSDASDGDDERDSSDGDDSDGSDDSGRPVIKSRSSSPDSLFVRANSEVKPEVDSDATISDGEITDGENGDDIEVKSEDSEEEKYVPDEYLDGSDVDTENISEPDFDIEDSDGSSERSADTEITDNKRAVINTSSNRNDTSVPTAASSSLSSAVPRQTASGPNNTLTSMNMLKQETPSANRLGPRLPSTGTSMLVPAGGYNRRSAAPIPTPVATPVGAALVPRLPSGPGLMNMNPSQSIVPETFGAVLAQTAFGATPTPAAFTSAASIPSLRPGPSIMNINTAQYKESGTSGAAPTQTAFSATPLSIGSSGQTGITAVTQANFTPASSALTRHAPRSSADPILTPFATANAAAVPIFPLSPGPMNGAPAILRVSLGQTTFNATRSSLGDTCLPARTRVVTAPNSMPTISALKREAPSILNPRPPRKPKIEPTPTRLTVGSGNGISMDDAIMISDDSDDDGPIRAKSKKRDPDAEMPDGAAYYMDVDMAAAGADVDAMDVDEDRSGPRGGSTSHGTRSRSSAPSEEFVIVDDSDNGIDFDSDDEMDGDEDATGEAGMNFEAEET